MTETEKKNLITEMREHGKSWDEISTFLLTHFGLSKTANGWRKYMGRRSTITVTITADPVKILKIVKGTPKRIQDLEKALGIGREDVIRAIEDLGKRGHEIHTDGSIAWLDTGVTGHTEEKREDWKGNRTIRFLALSDTHLCSRWQQMEHLNSAYDDAIEKECDFAVHCGDVTDGFYQNRPGHIYELFARGYDEQLDYIVSRYPKRTKKDGSAFVTKVISGNHDHTHLKADGANIVKAFARQREDIEFLGDSFCKIWLTPKCDMDIQHPCDGSQYAISYSTQKLIDAIQGGAKPKIFMVGHHHKGMYYPYRNIHTFEVPCLQAQTPFERGAKIAVTVGWWIVTVQVKEDGTVSRIIPEFVQCYEMKEEDY